MSAVELPDVLNYTHFDYRLIKMLTDANRISRNNVKRTMLSSRSWR